MKKKYSGAEAIEEFLYLNGYRHIFGIPGRRLLGLFDAVKRKNERIKIIKTSHEQGASFMADTYSRMNGKGCCVGISGPGAINLLAGVSSAYMDSVPLFVITGQVQVNAMGKYAIQETTGLGRTPNQLKIYESATKYAKRVERIEELQDVLEKAYIEMNTGRKGPVYIEVPTNILEEKHMFLLRKIKIEEIKERKNNEEKYKKIYEDLKKSKFPIFIIGNGVKLANSEKEYEKFLFKHNIAYTTSLLAKGIINEKKNISLGNMGIFGQKAANKIVLEDSDAIVAVGIAFQELTTMGWKKEIGEKLIARVDLDKNEIKRNYKAKTSICEDAKIFIEEFEEYLVKNKKTLDFSENIQQIEAIKNKYGYFSNSEKIKDEKHKIHPIHALEYINNQLNKEDLVIVDVGENAYWTGLFLERESTGTYTINGGYGSMGHAVAGSIGASIAKPESRIITICGDGGFLMTGNDIATAVKYNAKVIWCVFNNGILGTQKHFQQNNLNERYIGSDMPNIDINEYAKSMGAKTFKARNIKELASSFKKALNEKMPVVINICITESATPKPQCNF